VSEAAEPEPDPLMRFTRLFAASVGPLLTFAWCQASSWPRQRAQRPPEGADLGWHRLIGCVGSEGVEEPFRLFGGLGVEAAEGLLGVPAHPHLTPWVAGLEEPEQLLVALLVETFMALGQQTPTLVERIVAPSSVTERLVLHPTSALIELGARELHDVEQG
jgi:hypothetical protein